MSQRSFHVYANYGTKEQQWTVKICITCHAGRLLYVSGSAKTKKKVPKIPSLDVGDLALPDDKEVVKGTFDADGGGLLSKEGVADDIDDVVHNEELKFVAKQDFSGHKKDDVRLKSPMKVKWLAPLCYQAVAATPNISTKELVAVLTPYIIDIFLTNALIQLVRS